MTEFCHCEVPEARHHVKQYSRALPCHCEGAERPWQSQGSVACNSKTETNAKSLELNEITTSCATPRNDKYVSEAHGKELNVLTSYRLNDFTKKAAFTLAEVLITLGIIGVVAAMTIPTLISKYQDKVLENHFKKSYAMLNQALLSAQSQFGYLPRCYYEYGSPTSAISQDCGELTDKFLASLKIVKVCDGNSYEQGCIPEYRGVDDILKEEHEDDEDYDEEYWQDYANRNCGGFNTSSIRNINKSYVLSDGTIIFFYDNAGCKIIGLDINGKKGPNKWGYDLFSLYINSDGNRFRYEGDICIDAEEGGRSFKHMYADVFH